MKNYGLKYDQPDSSHWVFGGGNVPMEVLQPDKNWRNFLPKHEIQNQGIETYACVTFTLLNCLEILIKRQYGEERNYSDRFLAAVSGTKEGGNSPQVVCEFLRKVGVIPEELWPFNDKSFQDYYSPIPPKLYELAREFNEEWDFRHEFGLVYCKKY